MGRGNGDTVDPEWLDYDRFKTEVMATPGKDGSRGSTIGAMEGNGCQELTAVRVRQLPKFEGLLPIKRWRSSP
jgi:hypothetical protein